VGVQGFDTGFSATSRPAAAGVHPTCVFRAVAASSLLLLLAALLLLAPGSPAGAQGRFISGGAFALSVKSSLAWVSVAPTPAGIAGAASDPAAGFGPLNGERSLVKVPGLAALGEATASSKGEVAGGTVTSQSRLTGGSVAGGLVAVADIATTCTATTAGVRGSGQFSGVVVAGTAVAAAPAPNTVIAVAGVLRAVVNEQIRTDVAGTTSLVMRGLDVQILPQLPGSPILQIVVAESRCTVTAGVATPTTANTAARATTATTAGTRPPITFPIAGPVPTTTATTTSTVPATPANPPTTTPTSSPRHQAPVTPRLAVATSAGTASGPPGVGLRVSGSGYLGCADVVVFFERTRIGTTQPDHEGAIDQGGLAVPGDAATGGHEITAECRPVDRHRSATAAFEVTKAAIHRSAFVTSVAEPAQVATGITPIAASALVTLVLILLVAFPSELFNSTLDENYAEVRGWFGLRARNPRRRPRWWQISAFLAFVLAGGALYSVLSPDFGLNRSSLALALGFTVSLVIITVVFRLPSLFVVHRRYCEWAELRILPGTALVAAACVVLSRLLHFQPGYLYGLVAGLSLRHQLAKDTTGRVTSAAALSILVISVLAWFGRAPLAAAAARPHASFWVLAAEASLAALFVVGVESMVISLIPLRFLEGGKLTAWSRTAWFVIFGLGLFAFVHLLLRPTSGYVATTAGASRFVVVALFVGFGLFSIGFWAYFRFRPARPELRPA
jgi:hypothetical protein